MNNRVGHRRAIPKRQSGKMRPVFGFYWGVHDCTVMKERQRPCCTAPEFTVGNQGSRMIRAKWEWDG